MVLWETGQPDAVQARFPVPSIIVEMREIFSRCSFSSALQHSDRASTILRQHPAEQVWFKRHFLLQREQPLKFPRGQKEIHTWQGGQRQDSITQLGPRKLESEPQRQWVAPFWERHTFSWESRRDMNYQQNSLTVLSSRIGRFFSWQKL